MVKKASSTPSADAAAKRAIARRFNEVLGGKSSQSKPIDQRSVRKLEKFKRELRKGKTAGSKPLSALEIARRVHDLMESGLKIADIKQFAKPLDFDYDEDGLVELLSEMHPVYQFCADAYRFAGVRDETLCNAGVIGEIPKKRGPKKKIPD